MDGWAAGAPGATTSGAPVAWGALNGGPCRIGLGMQGCACGLWRLEGVCPIGLRRGVGRAMGRG